MDTQAAIIMEISKVVNTFRINLQSIDFTEEPMYHSPDVHPCSSRVKITFFMHGQRFGFIQNYYPHDYRVAEHIARSLVADIQMQNSKQMAAKF